MSSAVSSAQPAVLSAVLSEVRPTSRVSARVAVGRTSFDGLLLGARHTVASLKRDLPAALQGGNGFPQVPQGSGRYSKYERTSVRSTRAHSVTRRSTRP